MPESHPSTEIDCAELRRRLLVDPFDADPALLRHRDDCPECDRAARIALGLEAALRQALLVEPPAGLGARLAAARRRRSARGIAAVAGLLLSLGLSGWVGYGLHDWLRPAPTLAQLVREHIEHEALHLGARGNLSNVQVAAVLRQVGGDLMLPLGHVLFAGICPMHHSLGAHLVIQGARGPVTILFMPGEHQQDAQSVLTKTLQGLVVPTAYGSLAVVGVPGEPIDALIKRIQGSVTWGT